MARNANGASSSLRFSARLKWTRPTRFQAGLQRLSSSCVPRPERLRSSRNAAAISSHRDSRTLAVRYSAPVIGGAASASARSSSRGGGRETAGALVVLGSRAQRGHEQRTQLSPVREHGGQRRSHLSRAELQKTVAGPAAERRAKPRGDVLGESRRAFRSRQVQPAVRRERRGEGGVPDLGRLGQRTLRPRHALILFGGEPVAQDGSGWCCSWSRSSPANLRAESVENALTRRWRPIAGVWPSPRPGHRVRVIAMSFVRQR